MSDTALAIAPASATKWTVVSGHMAGSVRLMNAPVFYVGRSPECEFVIVNDPKCSRKHAQVTSDGYVCEVTSLNDKNPVRVNDREVERAPLNDGDIITFGETKVQFNLTNVQALAPQPYPQPYPQAVPDLGIAPAPAPARRKSRRSKRKTSAPSGSSSSMRFIVYGIVALLVYWVLSPTGAKKKQVQIRNEQQIKADIEAAKKLRDASEAQALERMDRSVPARQAQENYVRGFRAYHQGQYERALYSFRTCLALQPEHVLCNRYLRLAQRKFDELIQYQVTWGRRFRDQGQYSSCRASFRNVMVMVKTPSSPLYQEAKANYEACDNMIEDRY
jgi:hypothetical protein